MCVTFCHRLEILYWNHENCTRLTCEVVDDVGRCIDCIHQRQEGVCALTNAPLPVTGRCCHCNVTQKKGMRLVTRPMLAPLNVGDKAMVTVLEKLDVPVHNVCPGIIMIDPDELGLPFVYGEGTEPEEEDDDDLPFGPIDISEFEDFEW